MYPEPTDMNMSNGLMSIFQYTNQVTNNWISNLFIMMIWFIVFVGIYRARNDFVEGFAVTSFVTFVLSIIFSVLGFVSGWIVAILLGMTIISFLILWTSR